MLLSRFVPDDRWGKDPFTGEFATLAGFRHLVRTSVPVGEGFLVTFTAFRTSDRPDFSDDEIHAIEVFQPILSRMAFAALVSEKLGAPDPVPGTPAKTGFALFAPTGEVLRTDAGARAFLARLATAPNGMNQIAAEVLQLTKTGTDDETVERTFLPERSAALRVTFTRVGADGSEVAALFHELSLGPDPFGVAAARIGLSTRESEVARLVLQGKGNRGIAFALSLSIETVKTHLKSVFRKAGVSSRTELAAALLGPTA
jgi:DNA-binding CsgD family transcriptional regulator